jgi:hypothetical protein
MCNYAVVSVPILNLGMALPMIRYFLFFFFFSPRGSTVLEGPWPPHM